jgi:hypothetical protein
MKDLEGYILKNTQLKGVYFLLFPSEKENFFEAKYFSKDELALKSKKELPLKRIKERLKKGIYKTLIVDELEKLKSILHGKKLEKFKEIFGVKKFKLKTEYRDYFFFWNELKN